jgi:hypothetical protein
MPKQPTIGPYYISVPVITRVLKTSQYSRKLLLSGRLDRENRWFTEVWTGPTEAKKTTLINRSVFWGSKNLPGSGFVDPGHHNNVIVF